MHYGHLIKSYVRLHLQAVCEVYSSVMFIIQLNLSKLFSKMPNSPVLHDSYFKRMLIL
jgi:hypothetical protein